MPDWYILMRRASQRGLPFWPAPSILDLPTIVQDWHSIAVEAEMKAQPELARIQQKQAELAANSPAHAAMPSITPR